MFNPLSIVGKLPAPVMVLMTSALIGTAVFASASTLDITGGTMQSGTYADLECDLDGVEPRFVLALDNIALVESVYVQDVDDACHGQTIALQMHLGWDDDSNDYDESLSPLTEVVQYGVPTHFQFDDPVPSKDLDGLTITIFNKVDFTQEGDNQEDDDQEEKGKGKSDKGKSGKK